jgi:DNA-binding NtrC family response regulator
MHEPATDRKIFIVDDEHDFLETVSRALRTAGYRNIVLENDAHRAAAYFRDGGTAEVALVDLLLPGMSGVELLQVIRNHSPHTVPIMMTGSVDSETFTAARSCDAFEHLMKPVSLDKLISTMNRALTIRTPKPAG